MISIPEYKRETFSDLLKAKSIAQSRFGSIVSFIQYDIAMFEDREIPYDKVPEITIDKLCYDSKGYRFAETCRVNFKNKPVMFFKRAGRAGEDHQERAIINKQLYVDMIRHIEALYPPRGLEIKTVSKDDDAFEFVHYYGSSMTLITEE